MNIIIQQGFTETQRTQVAELYVSAFERKLVPLFKTIELAKSIVASELYPNCCFTAVNDSRQVLGVAGFQHDRKRCVNFSAGALMREFGWFSGALRYSATLLFERKPRTGTLQLDGIAVHSEARGLGIGTKLIAALEAFALQQGYQGVQLEVVDTNPHARRLYERLGFMEQHTNTYPFLRSAGFTSVTTMVKPL
jgi:ribosomal protein S18 acetylase RimI-like enzyme